MRFDIEGFITFDTEEASLVNLLTGDCIELSATSTRLLTSLLQYRGDIISRVDIFQTVFEKYGARPSNSNLNQYISTLRRSLADLGIEKITLPLSHCQPFLHSCLSVTCCNNIAKRRCY